MAKRKSSAASAPTVSDAAPSGSIVASEADWSIYRKIAWWSVLAIVFLVPIGMSNFGGGLPLTFDQFDMPKLFVLRVITWVALAAWVWDMCLNGGRIRHSKVDWLILAFLAWVAVSAAFSIHPPTAIFGKYRRFEGLLSFINYAVLYFLVLQLADKPSRIRVLAQTLFFSGILVAGYGVLQSIGLDFIDWGKLPFETNRAFSTFGNPDLLGGFLMFSMFVSLALAFSEEKLGWRIAYWVGSLLSMWCVVVAFTRSAWVGSLVGFFFIALFAVRQKISWTAVDWGFSGTTGALVSAVIVKSLSNPNSVMNFWLRVKSIFEFDQGSALTRFEIWSAAIAAIKARPIFGFGADTFRLVFPGYKPIEYTRDAGYLSVADNVHNYPLQLAAGIGIPGVLMFYGIAGWTAVKSWKTVFTRDGEASRMLLAGFWAACAAYITHLFFGLSVTGGSFMLWVSMAILLSPTASVTDFRAPSWGIIVAVIVVLLAVFGIVFQIRYTMADSAYLNARVAAVGKARTEYALRAVRLNPFNDIYRAEVGLAYADELSSALTVLQQGGDQAAALQNAQAAFVNAEDAFRFVIEFAPPEYDNYVFLANVYSIAGQVWGEEYFDRGIAVAEEGVRVSKYGPAIRYQLARLLWATGEIEDAEKHLLYALRLDPEYPEAAMFLATIYMDQGRTDEAIAVLEAAREANPSDPSIPQQLEEIRQAATSTPTP